MLRVIEGLIRHNGKHYAPGEFLPEMTEADEKRLIGLGFCEIIELPDEPEEDDQRDGKGSEDDNGKSGEGGQQDGEESDTDNKSGEQESGEDGQQDGDSEEGSADIDLTLDPDKLMQANSNKKSAGNKNGRNS